MDVLGIFSAFGLSASAGLNAYIPLLVISLVARFTNLFKLSAPWDVLESWWIIGALVVLITVEFFADKIPAVNHVNDVIQTFIRPAAGAVVFAASAKIITDVHPILAAILGLLVAGGVHVAKSAVVRPAVTATTGGTANAPVSMLEDAISTLLSIISTVVPILVAILLGLLIAWLLWRAVKRLETT
jgi:mannose/fructose/N-acetylgalactosamine-specific phosphotransferase system component IID